MLTGKEVALLETLLRGKAHDTYTYFLSWQVKTAIRHQFHCDVLWNGLYLPLASRGQKRVDCLRAPCSLVPAEPQGKVLLDQLLEQNKALTVNIGIPSPNHPLPPPKEISGDSTADPQGGTSGGHTHSSHVIEKQMFLMGTAPKG